MKKLPPALSLLAALPFLALASVTLAASEINFDPALTQPTLSSSLPSSALTSSLISVLPADEAFTLSALIELPDTVILMWDIAEGYYIYHKSLEFNEITSSYTHPPQIPEGKLIIDEFFGEVEVFYNKLLVRIPYDAPLTAKTIIIQLNYQGCAEAGFCYPMQQKQLSLELQ